MDTDPLSSDRPQHLTPGHGSSSFQKHLEEARNLRKNKMWETAIRSYQTVIKEEPANAQIRLEMGLCYEAWGRETDSQAFLILAIEQYRRAARLQPDTATYHDALLAASVKANQLEDLLYEYKTLSSTHGQNPFFSAMLKKIETLLLLRHQTPHKPPADRPWLRFMLGFVAPATALVCFIAWLAFGGLTLPLAAFRPVLLQIGLMSLVIYIAYLFLGDRGTR